MDRWLQRTNECHRAKARLRNCSLPALNSLPPLVNERVLSRDLIAAEKPSNKALKCSQHPKTKTPSKPPLSENNSDNLDAADDDAADGREFAAPLRPQGTIPSTTAGAPASAEVRRSWKKERRERRKREERERKKEREKEGSNRRRHRCSQPLQPPLPLHPHRHPTPFTRSPARPSPASSAWQASSPRTSTP